MCVGETSGQIVDDELCGTDVLEAKTEECFNTLCKTIHYLKFDFQVDILLKKSI